MSSHLDYEINKELGECYLFMGDLDKAEEYYRKAASSNGVHPDPYLGLATIAVQRGRLDEAMTLYRKATSIEETDKSLAGMGLVEMEIGAHDEAFTHFAQALERNPENAIALNCLVREGYHLGRVAEVIPYLESGVAASPDKETVRVALAGCLISAGRADEARDHLEYVLERHADYDDAKVLYDSIAA